MIDDRTEQCVNHSGEALASPLVRGVLAAVVSLGTALALTVVPALAAQVAGSRSTATALDAVIIGLNLLVLGHGGGITLSTGVIDGGVTLTPLGLMGLLVLVSALGMRRAGRVLELVQDDALRPRALGDAGSALAAYTAVYAIGVAVLAALGRSTDASPLTLPALLSGALVAVVGGLSGLLWSLHRKPTESSPGVRVLDLLPVPYDAVARAALIGVLGMIAAAALVVTVQLARGAQGAAALHEQLSPGIAGGIVLTLLQLAVLPLLIVWALVILLGGTVTMGVGTAYSLEGVDSGVMPALPILAALPEPGSAPSWTLALMLLPLGAVVVGAVRLVRDVAGLELRERITAWVAYPLVVTVVVLLLAGLSSGGIGDGRLIHLGPQMGTLLVPLLLITVGGTAAVLAILATGLIPWIQRSVAQLRRRVEDEEARERSDRGEHSAALPESAGLPESAARPTTAALVEGRAVSPDPEHEDLELGIPEHGDPEREDADRRGSEEPEDDAGAPEPEGLRTSSDLRNRSES